MIDSPFGSLPKMRSRGPLAEKVYAILKKAIIEGTLESGMWLQEESLTKALDVSRTPVREAFNRLKSDGIIDVIPRKGAHIIELSDRDLDELFEVREQIGTTFFIRSARNISPGTVQLFRERLQESERAIRGSLPGSDDWHVGR